MMNDLSGHFPGLLEITAGDIMMQIAAEPGIIVELCDILKHRYGYNYLANLTAVDQGEQFEIVYHLYSLPKNKAELNSYGVQPLCIKARISRELPEIDSLASLFATADWQEREVYDLMGIMFRNHPGLARILLPEGFAGHPLRKDYRSDEKVETRQGD